MRYFTRDRLTILVIVGSLFAALYMYSGDKYTFTDSMAVGAPDHVTTDSVPASADAPSASVLTTAAAPVGDGYAPQPIATPTELLPVDQNSQWAQLNPAGTGGLITADLLEAGKHMGMVHQTLKNPNLQLRADPIIQKSTTISPWNNSTTEPDLMRVPFEVGQAV